MLRYTYIAYLVKKKLLPYETSRIAVGVNQPPAAQILGSLPYGVDWPGHFHLASKLGVSGAETPAPHYVFTWRLQGQMYLCIFQKTV